MRRILIALMTAALGACVHAPPGPETVQELHQAHDWQHEGGEALQAAMARDVGRIARKAGRAATIAQLAEAGYECQYGEAHPAYPEPMAVCTRSFATRACQMDWEVWLEVDPMIPDGVAGVSAGFTRDCVNTADDWPEPVNSAIDDQLAPAGLTKSDLEFQKPDLHPGPIH